MRQRRSTRLVEEHDTTTEWMRQPPGKKTRRKKRVGVLVILLGFERGKG
jgi:hypothetical protein